MSEYRIEYSIQKLRDGAEDFTEIGFGSSGAWDDLDQCAHILTSAVENRKWEMPSPETPTRGDGCACGVTATHGPHESELPETPEHAVTCEPFQDCTCGATPEED